MEVDVNEAKRRPIAKEMSEGAFLAFAQNEYYAEKWRGLISGGAGLAGFNVWAAIFGATWCFYRKLYRLGIVVVFATIMAAFASFFMASAVIGMQFSPALNLILFIVPTIVIGIPVGMLANVIYFRKARKFIEQCVSSRMPSDYFEAALKDEGGVSLGALIAYLGVSGILSAVLKLV